MAAPINYIVNGGFETGDYSGWTSAGCGPAAVESSFAGWLPHSGNFFSAEGAIGCDHTLSQTFADVAGQSLLISFYLGSDGGTPNDLNVYWDGGLIYTATNIASTQPFYTHYTFNVLATGSDTLMLGILNDPSWQALDDVSVTTTVPEPGALILWGSGLIGVAAAVRRKLAK
jgi:hypothetical protein